MKAHRLARVAEVIREVASQTILFGLKDPRVKGVTVTRTEVSGDLQHAKIFVSIMGSASEQALCLHGLRHAAGFIQSKLADRLQMRFTPTLSFELDLGVKNSIHEKKQLAKFEKHAEQIVKVAFVQGGKQTMSASRDSAIKPWSMA